MDYFFQALASAFGLIFSFDGEIYTVVWTSVYISVIAVVVASIVGVPLGLIVAFQEFPGKKFLIQILNTLMAMPTVVV